MNFSLSKMIDLKLGFEGSEFLGSDSAFAGMTFKEAYIYYLIIGLAET